MLICNNREIKSLKKKKLQVDDCSPNLIFLEKKKKNRWKTGCRGEKEMEVKKKKTRGGRTVRGGEERHLLMFCGCVCMIQRDPSTIQCPTQRLEQVVACVVFSSADINEGGPYVTHWKL